MSETERLHRELDRSREARLRAWSALEGIRNVLVGTGLKIEQPAQKSFVQEGEILTRALKKTLSDRNEALRELADAARWVDKAAFGDQSDFGQAHQAVLKALDRAERFL